MKKLLRKYLQRSHRFPWIIRRKDRFLTVRMDTTNRCNLRCSMCPMRLSDKDPDRIWKNIDPDLFSRIAEDLFPSAEVVGLSCGAEPLINPDFRHYLEILYKADVPVREVVTNGTLLTDEHIEMFLDSPPTTIFVSIDGADPHTHAQIRGGADLEHITTMLKKLVESRDRRKKKFPMVSFSVTLQKSNIAELPEIIRLASEIGIESVSTVPLVAYEGLEMSDETIDMSSVEIQDIIREAEITAEELGIVLSVPSNDTESKNDPCRYLSSWIFVDPDGKVYPCPYWNTSHPVGDFLMDSFEHIWNGDAYIRLRAQVRSGSLSGTCAVCPEYGDSRDAEIVKTDI